VADLGEDKDQATYDAHFKTDYFTALAPMIQSEGLLAGPLDIKTIKPIGGFASR
jgi:quinol monooxygenase YgiN